MNIINGPISSERVCRVTEASKTATTMRALLEWTYGAQKAHRGNTSGARAVGYASVSQTGAVIERLRLGHSVSGGGSDKRAQCDDDALAVHSWVLRLTSDERALVIRCAEARCSPDWSPVIPEYRCVPVKGRRGRLYKGIYDKSNHEIGCEIQFTGFSPRRAANLVQHARETYGRWYSTLSMLRDAINLTGDLQRWSVAAVGAQPEPWRG